MKPHIGYIIRSKKKIVKKYLPFTFLKYGEYFCCFKTKKALVSYCQFKECDWINLVMGPKIFFTMPEKYYNRMVDLIHHGEYVTYARLWNSIDWPSMEKRNKEFEDMIRSQGGTIDMREEI